MQELTRAAIELARGAGRALVQAYGRGPKIEHKGLIDLVTDADRAAEDLILAELDRRFPDHAVFSEESGSTRADGPWRWIVDPLDGTTNFAHGLPHFAVLIALEERVAPGCFETRAAVTFDPLRDELFVAERGGGATLNGAPLHVSGTTRLMSAVLATGFAYDRLWSERDNHAEFCRLNLVSQGVRRMGSAGLDLAYVACGRLDGFWEYDLKPWDFAGGVLLVVEAGGCVDTVEREPLTLASRSILATNGLLHAPMAAALRSAAAVPVNSRRGLAELLPPEVADRLAAQEE